MGSAGLRPGSQTPQANAFVDARLELGPKLYRPLSEAGAESFLFRASELSFDIQDA